MGCIEISVVAGIAGGTTSINRNMGCIEMQMNVDKLKSRYR